MSEIPAAHPLVDPEGVLDKLIAWVEQQDYAGFDPYDGLNLTARSIVREHRVANAAVTQAFKRLPVNLRTSLHMPRTKMPKSIGLFLTGYALLAARARVAGDRAAEDVLLRRCSALVDWLGENVSPGYARGAWNFGFDYKQLSNLPTVVITGIVARGLFAYHQLTFDATAGTLLRGACDFVANDLERTETSYGLSFSYTPAGADGARGKLRCCYNASLLGAEVLAMGYAVWRDPSFQEDVRRALDFVIEHQQPDGRWNYSLDLASGRERKQVDFHQGFVIDSILACTRHAQLADERYKTALARGAAFYRNEQFTEDGRALWRLPRSWPADIHCQAQGIITFSKLASLDPAHGAFAGRIAEWTVRHMWNPRGFFYYRKGRLFDNRIPYMRWGQAWMMLALAQLTAGANLSPQIVSAR